VTGPPGSTTPLAGETENHVAVPAEAVKEIGPALVVNCTVCATGLGGAANVNDDGLAVSVGGGSVTTSFTWVTPAVPGGTAAAGVNVTDAV
jgi:hypothetical protein